MLSVAPASRTLAQLAEETGEAWPPDALSASQIVHWFRRNKFPLLALAEQAPPWLRCEQTYQRELLAELEWFNTQRQEYAVVHQAWLDREIECLMIKSAGNYPSFPHTSDNIDVLVKPEHGAAARDILRCLGYVEVRNVEEPKKFLFRKFHDGRCVSAIHVHEQVAWFVGFMDDAALWARMRAADDDPLVNIPSPEDAILINLAHACYENKRLRFNDLARIRHALRACGGRLDWAYMEHVAASRGWLDGLSFLLLVYAELEAALFGSTLIPPARLERCERRLDALRFPRRRLEALRSAQGVDLPLELSYWFCKRLYYRKILADPTRTRAQRWRDAGLTLMWGIKLKSGIRPQPGMVVAISGPDGSGKTAQAQALVQALRLCEIKADYFWSRAGSTGIAALVSRARHRLVPTAGNGRDEQGDSVTRRRRRLATPIARLLWAWLVALDQIGTFVLRVKVPALSGRVVVCDRYVYDAAVEMECSLPKDARWSQLAIDAMLALAPHPQIAYVLDVSPQTAQARKPDEAWHSDLETERDGYRALARQLGLRLLSTEGLFAESNDVVVRETIMAYMSGFETWLNALFLANPTQKNVPDLVWARGGAR